MRAMRAALLAAAALALGQGPAWACAGQITAAPEPRLTYQPFEVAGAAAEQRVTVRNNGGEACIFQLDFARLDHAGQGLGGLDFTIKGVSGEVLAAAAPSSASAAGLTSRPLAPDESFDFVYSVSVPAGQVTPPGDYQQMFELRLRGASGAPQILDTRPLRLSCLVQRYLSINIAGAGTRTTIDFGVLAEGATRHVRIATRSNQPFALAATSQNGGAMAMAPPLQSWRVPYAMTLNGAAVAFPASLGPFNGTGLAGHELDIVFTIGDIANKRAGLYADEITIEIKPAI
ncbi:MULTISPECIES: hypothetical protein [Rhodomicrobium]|uniref:hypothetical protein n=1 Tax=Rhodomicrobium TaxID=1068 RepID=UPI000B4A6A54|nr:MULTISPECIES: hypothetical protein [Rhodomicrobium]